MKILMINKFLFPKGGSETYVLNLGKQLTKAGHQVEYFGMQDEKNIVGNCVESYTTNMEFHGNSIKKLLYPFKIIYSWEARKKLRVLLKAFQPDVIHLNNFNYQLTPSILIEILNYRKAFHKKIKVLYTAHDYQLLCPNHMMRNYKGNCNCEKCIKDGYLNCVKGKCIHGSKMRSLLGFSEAWYWNKRRIYENIDVIICPSYFMEKKIKENAGLRNKTVVMHNFVEKEKNGNRYLEPKQYVLYFGRYSAEKGVETLIKAAKDLSGISFVFAGDGPLEDHLKGISNIRNVGFIRGMELVKLIQGAAFTICPSECYENCPFSVIESQVYGVPVLGADIGGIPELIQPGKTGELFQSGNIVELKGKIEKLWNDFMGIRNMAENCAEVRFDSTEEYTGKLLCIYKGI